MMTKMITMMLNMMNGMDTLYLYSIWETMMKKIKRQISPTIMLIDVWRKEDKGKYLITCQKSHPL